MMLGAILGRVVKKIYQDMTFVGHLHFLKETK